MGEPERAPRLPPGGGPRRPARVDPARRRVEDDPASRLHGADEARRKPARRRPAHSRRRRARVGVPGDRRAPSPPAHGSLRRVRLPRRIAEHVREREGLFADCGDPCLFHNDCHERLSSSRREAPVGRSPASSTSGTPSPPIRSSISPRRRRTHGGPANGGSTRWPRATAISATTGEKPSSCTSSTIASSCGGGSRPPARSSTCCRGSRRQSRARSAFRRCLGRQLSDDLEERTQACPG